MSVSAVRFRGVYKPEQATLGQLKALREKWDGDGYLSEFVKEFHTDPLGMVVILTDKDALIAQENKATLKKYRHVLGKKSQGVFKGFSYWYAEQLRKLTGVQSPKALRVWYLTATQEQIQSVHKHLADWATQHYQKPKPFNKKTTHIQKSFRVPGNGTMN